MKTWNAINIPHHLTKFTGLSLVSGSEFGGQMAMTIALVLAIAMGRGSW